jgi:hypothetical protein
LQANIKSTQKSLTEAIKLTAKESEKRVEKKVNEKLANIPGYEAPNISQKLGYK